MHNPYPEGDIKYELYTKEWIDTVQWHLEDIIRDPKIKPATALEIKRRIDRSNQARTDLVERIDSYFLTKYKDVETLPSATINTESPAWAIDRLAILCAENLSHENRSRKERCLEEHRERCRKKLDVLTEQWKDLSSAIDTLLDDIEAGRKYMKVYKQMKMYNDKDTNPVLYAGGK